MSRCEVVYRSWYDFDYSHYVVFGGICERPFCIIYARRGCFAEGELWQTFCGALGVCLSWSIRCNVELVWSCYASYMAKAVGNGKVMAMGEAVSGYILLREGALSEAIYYIYINRCEVGSYAEAE